MTIILIVLATSIVVFFDSKRLSNTAGGFLFGVWIPGHWAWFLSCLLLWIVAFPAYLIYRKRQLVRDDKPNKYGFPIFGTISIVTILALFGFSFAQLGKLPTCEFAATQAKEAAQSIIVRNGIKAEIHAIVKIQEVGQDNDAETRVCQATLISSLGHDQLMYVVKWLDKPAKKFYVETKLLK